LARHHTRHPNARSQERLPETAIVEITGTDLDGEPTAKPVVWDGGGRPPRIVMAPEKRGQPALAVGARVLARLRPIGPGQYEGRTMRRIEGHSGRILGVYRGAPSGPGRLAPTGRREKTEWLIPAGETLGAEPDELVLAEPLPHSKLGLRPARVIERLGRLGDARSASLVAIHTHGIPEAFPPAALEEAAAAGPAPLGDREDLRHLPLVTIDGADARDFDDAVWAAAREDGGFDLLVAIADVADYVREGSALDQAAATRGTSVYFPDRVVPMLPEALSNGWCSLKPNEDRPVLAMAITIDADGRKTSHRVLRGMMRSAARLTYEQAQAESDRHVALFGAYAALAKARAARGTLDLDLPERRVLLDAAGQVASIEPRARLDSHRLIEEFMILANVAAAEALEAKATPCVYRIHDRPSDEKVAALRDYLDSLGLSIAPPKQLMPKHFAAILDRVRGTEHEASVNEMVLRSQAQAEYGTDNIGHFGLALARYAHFTSPIRRYPDLLVHRALIRAYRLGEGGLADPAALTALAKASAMAERRAVAAERDAMDRYLAAYMADRVGESFRARISGVTRFGLFVTLDASGASGLVPMRALPDDFWLHDDAAHTLTGRHSGTVFRLGQPLPVRLSEANALTGGLVFAVDGPPPPLRRRKGGRRPRR
jgi:ribonuclease R